MAGSAALTRCKKQQQASANRLPQLGLVRVVELYRGDLGLCGLVCGLIHGLRGQGSKLLGFVMLGFFFIVRILVL